MTYYCNKQSTQRCVKKRILNYLLSSPAAKSAALFFFDFALGKSNQCRKRSNNRKVNETDVLSIARTRPLPSWKKYFSQGRNVFLQLFCHLILTKESNNAKLFSSHAYLNWQLSPKAYKSSFKWPLFQLGSGT